MAKPKKPKTVNRVLPEGTIIGECDCAGCGVRVPLKENSAGGVYYFCARVVDEASGERCYSRHALGRVASKRVIEEFLKQQQQPSEEQNDAEHIDRVEETIIPAAEPDGEARANLDERAGCQPAGEQPPEQQPAPTAGKRRGLSSWFD